MTTKVYPSGTPNMEKFREFKALEKDIVAAVSSYENGYYETLDLLSDKLINDLPPESVAEIMLTVFKAGKKAGKESLKKRITNL